MPAADGVAPRGDLLADVLAHLTDTGADSLAPEAWVGWWANALAPNPPPAKIQPRPVVDARGVRVVNVVEGLQPIPWIGPVAWLTIPEAHHVDGTATPAHTIAPAEALELLRTLTPPLWSWDVGADEAPRWWCEACRGTGEAPPDRLMVRDCLECLPPGAIYGGSGPGHDSPGHTDAPRSLADLVAAASNPRLREACALAREIAPAAPTIVLRVMSARELREHHGKHAVSWDVTLPLVFSREMSPPTGNVPVRDRWPVEAPYSGQFGTPDDDRHGVHRAWPALRALAACQVHLLALSPGRVVLGVVAIAGEP